MKYPKHYGATLLKLVKTPKHVIMQSTIFRWEQDYIYEPILCLHFWNQYLDKIFLQDEYKVEWWLSMELVKAINFVNGSLGYLGVRQNMSVGHPRVSTGLPVGNPWVEWPVGLDLFQMWVMVDLSNGDQQTKYPSWVLAISVSIFTFLS